MPHTTRTPHTIRTPHIKNWDNLINLVNLEGLLKIWKSFLVFKLFARQFGSTAIYWWSLIGVRLWSSWQVCRLVARRTELLHFVSSSSGKCPSLASPSKSVCTISIRRPARTVLPAGLTFCVRTNITPVAMVRPVCKWMPKRMLEHIVKLNVEHCQTWPNTHTAKPLIHLDAIRSGIWTY